MKRKVKNLWKKGVLAVVAAVVIVAAYLPMTSFAQGTYYYMTPEGEFVTDGDMTNRVANFYIEDNQKSNITYDDVTHTLTLENATIYHLSVYCCATMRNEEPYDIISYDIQDLKIHLKGTNKIEKESGSDYLGDLTADVTFTITAEPGATLTCTKIYNMGDIKLDASVEKTAGEHKVVSEGGYVDEYDANVVYTGKAAAEPEDTKPEDKPADTTPTDKPADTTPTDKPAENKPAATAPVILNGATQATTPEQGLTVRASGEITDFINLYIDDVLVDRANYTLTEGSTIVTLKKEFLETLTNGEHVLRFSFTTGDVQTGFTLSGAKEATATQTTVAPTKSTASTAAAATTAVSPKTGSSIFVTFFVVVTLIIGSGVIAIALSKRNQKKA